MRLCAHKAVGMPVTAFAKQVQIEIAELLGETIRIVIDMRIAGSVGPLQTIALRHRARRPLPGKEVRTGDALHGRLVFDQLRGTCAREIGEYAFAAAMRMTPEYGEGIVMARFGNQLQRRVACIGQGACGFRHGTLPSEVQVCPRGLAPGHGCHSKLMVKWYHRPARGTVCAVEAVCFRSSRSYPGSGVKSH